MLAALPVYPNWFTSTSRLSATPSLSVSCNRQMFGGEATYSAPSCHNAPCGKVILSAKIVEWSKRPSPSRSSSRRMKFGNCSSNSFDRRLSPALSAMNKRPRSSKQAIIGCLTSGGPAATSTVMVCDSPAAPEPVRGRRGKVLSEDARGGYCSRPFFPTIGDLTPVPEEEEEEEEDPEADDEGDEKPGALMPDLDPERTPSWR